MTFYALVTAARNEEKYIDKTLTSVTSQTVLPGKWVLVSDGSTDGTDEIVQRYARTFQFVHLIRQGKSLERDFASKVRALNAGMRLIENEPFQFVGHLDADVSFAPSYFHDLFRRFEDDPTLGLAGGVICEQVNGQFVPTRGRRSMSVAGAVQMFRRECYRDIGPFPPIEHGGEDWYAEVAARMRGWRVESFPELEVRHHRRTGSVGGVLPSWYREGLMDYSIGSHPIFEVAKLARHALYRPFLLGSLARLSGFVVGSLRRERRLVSAEFVSYLRMEQIARLRTIGHRYPTSIGSHS